MSNRDNAYYERKSFLHKNGWNWTFDSKTVKKHKLYTENEFALIRPEIRRDA